MSKRARAILILAAAGIIAVLTGWILLPPLVEKCSTDGSIRTFNLFECLPIDYTKYDLTGIPPSSGTHEVVPVERIEIEGVDPTPTPTPEFVAPSTIARPYFLIPCRTGPRICDPPLAYLGASQALPVDGRAYDDTWLNLVLVPYDLTCWARADFIDVTGDLDQVPEIEPGLLPCTTPSPTEAPTGCWVIDAQQHPNGYCRPGACTPNDTPGTPCTPP
jgi:hypothetical protein